MSGAAATVDLPLLRGSRAVRRYRVGPALLVAPLVLYMLAFYALPLAAMLLRSVTDPAWTLENYQRLLGDTVFLQVFWTTLRTALVVTACSLLLGYPVALALS